MEFVNLHHIVKETLFDILIVKEITGGVYNGERGRLEGPCEKDLCKCREAFDTERYSWKQIEAALRIGYDHAQQRRKKLCIVDKADKLESSRLWREVAELVIKDFPQIETSFLYVDEAAGQLVSAPQKFDVIVTTGLFGDILYSELSALAAM